MYQSGTEKITRGVRVKKWQFLGPILNKYLYQGDGVMVVAVTTKC